jgi:small-conductance mechanosensitive channel
MSFLQGIDWQSMFTPDTLWTLVRVLLYAVAGFVLLRVVVLVLKRILRRSTTAQVTMLVTKGINYAGIAVIVTLVLVELGVNLAPILGAAGIVGLAVGIASQASLSNIISGLFLVSEKPFEIGDVIKTGETVGVVDSIDLLSVKIRTFDNVFIRVPNERLANTQLTNVTRYPIRRMDFTIRVDFSEDMSTVESILRDIAANDPACLAEPEPFVLFREFTDAGATVMFGVWFQKADYVAVKNRVFTAILSRFREAGIRIPLGSRSLHPAEGEPFPVRLVNPYPDPGPAASDEKKA